MKNFLYREDHAPVCPAFSNYYKVYVNPTQYVREAQKSHQYRVTAIGPSMVLVFFLCHQQMLYRKKIKSPE